MRALPVTQIHARIMSRSITLGGSLLPQKPEAVGLTH